MKPEEIKAARIKAALSRAQLAERVGVSPRTIKSWEIGDRNPSEQAKKILKIFL